MSRAKFQVLIIPFKVVENGETKYAVTKRSDRDVWQFLSGGGEDNETPIQAAKREAYEEGNVPSDAAFLGLDSTASIPAIIFSAHVEWGQNVYVVPEYTFGVDCAGRELILSSEHTELHWLEYDKASAKLNYDSNRTALWELNERIRRGAMTRRL